MTQPFIIQHPELRLTIGIEVRGRALHLAIAMCHPNDQYVRKVGYQKVCGLLKARDNLPVGLVPEGVDWKDTPVLARIKRLLSHIPGEKNKLDNYSPTLRKRDYPVRVLIREAIVNACKISLNPVEAEVV